LGEVLLLPASSGRAFCSVTAEADDRGSAVLARALTGWAVHRQWSGNAYEFITRIGWLESAVRTEIDANRVIGMTRLASWAVE